MGSKKKTAKEKPLDKMTSKELRDVAKEIPEIIGIHGMNKLELLSEIKKVRGIEDTTTAKDINAIRELKKKIRELKVKQAEALAAEDAKNVSMIRKKINKLKKKTRKAA